MEIKHIKGKENKTVDTLNRNPHQILTYAGISVNFDVEEQIHGLLMQDQQYVKLQEKLQQAEIAGYTINHQGLIR